MRMDYETIALERIDKHILLYTMNRPEVMNAKNTKMGVEQKEIFEELYVRQHDLRCVVITGRGKAFSAGGDLKERNQMSNEEWEQQHATFEQAGNALRDCPIPVIAAVNGAAFGGGTELALSCDFIYAAATARFALSEIGLGIMPGGMGTINLPNAVGERRAKEVIWTAQPFSAEEAHDWGLVNKLCQPDSLMDETLAVARRLSEVAPLAVMRSKRSMSIATQVDRGTGMQFELEAYNRLVGTDDRLEGVRAFNEKRKADFKGR